MDISIDSAMPCNIEPYQPDLGLWYNLLVDDCQAIATECEFTARWALIEGYHQIGMRIIQDEREFTRCAYGERIIETVAKSLNKSPRTIYYAVSVAKQFPLIDSIPLGKDASWSQVIKLLDNGTGHKEECKHATTETVLRCSNCHKIIK